MNEDSPNVKREPHAPQGATIRAKRAGRQARAEAARRELSALTWGFEVKGSAPFISADAPERVTRQAAGRARKRANCKQLNHNPRSCLLEITQPLPWREGARWRNGYAPSVHARASWFDSRSGLQFSFKCHMRSGAGGARSQIVAGSGRRSDGGRARGCPCPPGAPRPLGVERRRGRDLDRSPPPSPPCGRDSLRGR